MDDCKIAIVFHTVIDNGTKEDTGEECLIPLDNNTDSGNYMLARY